MNYIHLYNHLKQTYNGGDSEIPIRDSGISFHNVPFSSTPISSGKEPAGYRFDKKIYNALLKYYLKLNTYSNEYIFHSLNEKDENIEENNSFNYITVKKQSSGRSDSCLLLLHGLNERSWDKYLPWAFELVSKTGKPVILFPLAFHMNRAPREWSDPRLMKEVSNERSRLFPEVESSTFANAALSTRLQFSPGRFLLSGVQTFYDIVKLLDIIRQGEHPRFGKDAAVDIFGYSIGAFLSQMLMMSNPKGHFSNSKLFLFCGGCTMDRMQPVSKAIMDSEAALALKNFYIDGVGNEFLNDELIQSTLAQFDEGGKLFQSMLDHTNIEEFRNAKFKTFADRCMIIPLQKDRVMSPESVSVTLRKHFHNNIRPDDFPYQYSHENPFPVNERINDQVNESFHRIFDCAGRFLT